MNKPAEEFNREVANNIEALGEDKSLRHLSLAWIEHANRYKYTYNFSCLGRPVIQYPQDIVAMQELVWKVKPDLIIETGIAHGGSLIMNASLLAMLDYCEAVERGSPLDHGARADVCWASTSTSAIITVKPLKHIRCRTTLT